jgi:hypothetical protein
VRAYKLKKCKRVHGLHFAPDGSRLLAVGGAEVRMVDVAVWLDLTTGENVGRIECLANCYAVDPQLTRYAVGGANTYDQWLDPEPEAVASVQWTAPVVDVEWETFRPRAGKAPPRFAGVAGLAFDPTGTRLAVTHSRRARQAAGVRPVAGGARSVSSEFVFTTTVVEADTGKALARLPVETEACVMAFNADGTRLAATGGVDGDTRAFVYDLATEQELFVVAPAATVTRCVRFLPDDRLVVANGRYVYVVPPDGGDPQFVLSGHPKQVNAVAVTPDGRRILTAAHDGSIRTWDADTGAPGPAFDWGVGAVTAVAFAPDGLTCAAAGLNGKVVVWDVDG